MEKIKQTTADTVEQNIEKISKLFPNVITETKDDDGNIKKAIDFEKLKQELSKEIIKGEESYDFTWVGKSQAVIEANTPTTKTLRPCKAESVNWDKTENVYIEGDNLEVLKILQETYLNKIKMIYIDPPYNTGKDFIYNDSFEIDKEEYEQELNLRDDDGNKQFKENNDSNPRFHSDWCSMIYSRLKIARNLLTDDGVIFISIDDNEVDNLKKICNEIFGEDNFKSQSIIINNRGGRDYGGIAKQHDYILIYTKSSNSELNLIEEKNKIFQYQDAKGGFNLMELRNRNIKFNDKNRPNLFYPFYVNPSSADENGLMEISLEPQKNYIKVLPAKSNGIQTVWRWGKEEKARKNLNIEIFGKENKNGGYMIVQKYRKTTKMQRSIWDEKEFVNEIGTERIKELFGKTYFDYPKSPYTLKRVIELGSSNNSIILDFFSGSATTADAVMQLNANEETTGKRKFIMVQLPEQYDEKSEAYKAGYKNICDIGKERIRRAGKKIVEETGKTDLDIGFRVFKVDESNMKDVYFTPAEYNQGTLDQIESNIKEDRNSEDLLFSCMLNWGLELSLPHKIEKIENNEIHIVNENELIACFDTNISENVVKKIAEKQPLRVIFRDNSFGKDSDRINVEEIFKLKSPNTKIKVL